MQGGGQIGESGQNVKISSYKKWVLGHRAGDYIWKPAKIVDLKSSHYKKKKTVIICADKLNLTKLTVVIL